MRNAITRSRKIHIIHISDLHFGSHHRFQPPVTPDGDRIKDDTYPILIDTLLKDIKTYPGQNDPVIIINTGDSTETANLNEFKDAKNFIENLLGRNY
jgi:3',5'-cyclic AMP phosphodiesterase CpdA